MRGEKCVLQICSSTSAEPRYPMQLCARRRAPHWYIASSALASVFLNSAFDRVNPRQCIVAWYSRMPVASLSPSFSRSQLNGNKQTTIDTTTTTARCDLSLDHAERARIAPQPTHNGSSRGEGQGIGTLSALSTYHRQIDLFLELGHGVRGALPIYMYLFIDLLL